MYQKLTYPGFTTLDYVVDLDGLDAAESISVDVDGTPMIPPNGFTVANAGIFIPAGTNDEGSVTNIRVGFGATTTTFVNDADNSVVGVNTYCAVTGQLVVGDGTSRITVTNSGDLAMPAAEALLRITLMGQETFD